MDFSRSFRLILMHTLKKVGKKIKQKLRGKEAKRKGLE